MIFYDCFVKFAIIMIQRIQSIYLLLAALISGSIPFVMNFWSNETIKDSNLLYILIGFIVSSILSAISIFMFKNRKSQFIINRLNIILNFIILAVFVYGILTTSGEVKSSEKGVEIIPIISIVLLVLSNKAIKKDEDLVKSVDRLR